MYFIISFRTTLAKCYKLGGQKNLIFVSLGQRGRQEGASPAPLTGWEEGAVRAVLRP